ncbi:glycine oxidase ThiO [Aquibacillus sp. 3ASR75-11]|uniref:glycine oxidase n=1 Tax=Terrihalobacillus insolitus TaxID=2950438 RepID=A0A9X3WXK4_9BACI|nr:glycine oxidase ThiO [Terrihalobacillus insolitus]MDC3413491.1 glycine oxidase ThiO [Terrihalobacillus insolitus]MDC3425219.1 glycine oxidase ThiO [Terrihalobacillus insolitus]
MENMYDAIIVGGGVIGGAIAYSLAKRGKKVLLLEKDRLANKASGAAAGMLAAQAELDEDGPLFQLAKKSRDLFPALKKDIKELSGIDIGLINKGMLKIALTKQEEQEYKRIIAIQQRAGEQVQWLTGEEAREKEPALSNTVLGAMYIEKDGQVEAPQLTLGFLKSAAALGVVIKEHIEVQSFHYENGNVAGVITNEGDFISNNVIVAGGAWSNKLLQDSELKLEAYPVKGECFSVCTHRPLFSSTIFSHGCYLVPKQGGRIIVGATVIPKTFDQSVTVDGISLLIERAKSLVPSIGEAEWEKVWAGIRPQTADGLPYLGEHPTCKGLFVATGHFRNGILLSAITGEVVSDLVEDKPTEMDLTPFRLDRMSEILT